MKKLFNNYNKQWVLCTKHISGQGNIPKLIMGLKICSGIDVKKFDIAAAVKTMWREIFWCFPAVDGAQAIFLALVFGAGWARRFTRASEFFTLEKANAVAWIRVRCLELIHLDLSNCIPLASADIRRISGPQASQQRFRSAEMKLKTAVGANLFAPTVWSTSFFG